MKICYYIFFKHEIGRKKKIITIRGKDENNVKKSYKMFVILYIKLVAFEYALVCPPTFSHTG